MAGSLPAAAVFTEHRSPRNHLTYSKREGRGNMYFETFDITSPTVKFFIEMSSTNNISQRRMVHLRCFQNNRYLVRESETSQWINAEAERPEEDTSRWSCTLFAVEDFRPGDTPIWISTRLKLRHIQSGAYLYGYQYQGSGTSLIRRLGLNENGQSMWPLVLTDWESLTILPDDVAFKGSNGKYLATVRRTGDQINHHLQFSSDDIGDEAVRYKVSYSNNGLINVKSLLRDYQSNRGFWRVTGNREVVVNQSNGGHEFRGVKIDGAEMSIDFGTQYCRRFTDNFLIWGSEKTIVRDAIVTVEEPVRSRLVYDVVYHLDDVRIYDQTPIIMASYPATNNSDNPLQREYEVKFMTQSESTWNAFISLELTTKLRIRAGLPKIFGGSITISNTIYGEYEWGKTKTESLEITDRGSFTVPPRSEITAYIVGTRGKCDIPFSYTVRDVLTTGQTRIYNVDGGVYNGVDNYSFRLILSPATPLDN